MSIRAKLLIAGVALSLVTFYLAYVGASSSWQYYLTVDECVKHGSEFAGRSVRVSGHVARGSLSFDGNRRRATFILTGSDGRLQTTCLGPLPDNLAEDMDVVVEGRLESANLLKGEKVLTRCASKYASSESSK
jgi:cytochrome c-type biogenesis protein CcmE